MVPLKVPVAETKNVIPAKAGIHFFVRKVVSRTNSPLPSQERQTFITGTIHKMDRL